MLAHKYCELIWEWGFLAGGPNLGRQRSGTVSWILRDYLDAHHTLSAVTKLGIYHTRKKAKKDTRFI